MHAKDYFKLHFHLFFEHMFKTPFRMQHLRIAQNIYSS